MEGEMVRLFRSLLFYTILLFSTVILGSCAMFLAYITGNGKQAHLCARLWGNINLWAAGVKVRVSGLENIDPEQAYIYAANHQGWFDIFAILGKLPVQFRWLAKEELFKVPILGPTMSAAGYIPIDRRDRRKAFESLSQAALKVREGTSVVIFPEGTRSLDGILQDFKKGGFILAITAGRPIVPISISGSHRVLAKHGGWMIRPGLVGMTIGAPIPTAGYTTKDRDVLMSGVREALRKYLPQKEGGLLPDEEAARSQHIFSSM